MKKSPRKDERLDILLVLPIVLCGLALAHLNHARDMFRIGRYIRVQLWPTLRRTLGPVTMAIPSWEDHIADKRHLDRPFWPPTGWVTWLPEALIFGFPSIGALALTYPDSAPAWDWLPGTPDGGLAAVWLIDVVLLALAVIAAIRVGWETRSARARRRLPPAYG
jgi:hypothetical protein